MAHQAKAGRVGLTQAGVTHARLRCIVAQQLTLVKTPLGVDALLIVGKGLQLSVCQELELGDADAMLTRDNPVE